ncbi:Fucoxanthin-chlorophyll a-c binding protein A, chloroplastic [Symbiodinium microadriaticum]|uniref:Fucoxanthin-chlorophyll a-c binding protein A, chloroplastic n=1 Tax=Symbiodinium microadriaticum TaxID=2951 RepID=A0A1Q9CAD0_SYMMI|nr:Fucoxanthin-chlorophyll a-c binding protein A, chloroplastic [Symbiodinium microadriaticum]
MVQAREDGSFIFYVSDMFVEALLRVSGHGGVFIKCHADEGRPLMELLWLDAGVSLDKALEYLKDTRVMGLTESGESGRVAIFFATQGAMDELRDSSGCRGGGRTDSPAHYMFHVCEDSRAVVRVMEVASVQTATRASSSSARHLVLVELGVVFKGTPQQRTAIPVALKAFENELGVQDPVGLWDPVGFTSDGDVAAFKRSATVRKKDAEVARDICYITPEVTGKLPGFLSPSAGLKFADIPNGLAAVSKVPVAGWAQIAVYFGFVEFSGGFDDYKSGTPGDYGFKVLTSSDPAEKTKKLSAELANGRLAMMAIIGMFFQDGLTGSAWGDWANYTASPLRAFESELGVQAPVGFWDPAGFTKDGNADNFARRRQTELKHGRIAMLATMGYITPEFSKWPGYLSPTLGIKFADVPNGLAAISKVPISGWTQILLWGAYCETSQDQSPGTPGAAGDFGWKVLTSDDAETKTKKLAAELANGRLAMMAIIGMFFQDGLTGSAWGDWANYTASPLRAFESELGVQDPVGFWDPVGFTSDGDVASFKRRRSVELKHGRPGFLSPSAGLKFADIPNGLAAVSKVPVAGWAQIAAYFGFVEFSGGFDDYKSGTPGDYGFKVLTSSDPAEKTKKLSAELANGRLAMMAIIGMFFQDGLTGSAWGDWANYTASPLRAFESELGVQAPVGFWDPAGFTKDGNADNFARRRQTELKHGRIAMLATMGYITPEFSKWPGYLSPTLGIKFADVPNGLAAISKVPISGWTQILLWGAYCETSQDQSPGTPGAAGDFGWKVLTSDDAETKTKKLAAELANGRLAMMAIIGMFFQDGLTGSAWGDWANYTASPLRAFENELGVQDPVGFWDPAGFTADGSVENFKRRRQTELKHGRISMLATMGYITPEHPLDYSFGEKPGLTCIYPVQEKSQLLLSFEMLSACPVPVVPWPNLRQAPAQGVTKKLPLMSPLLQMLKLLYVLLSPGSAYQQVKNGRAPCKAVAGRLWFVSCLLDHKFVTQSRFLEACEMCKLQVLPLPYARKTVVVHVKVWILQRELEPPYAEAHMSHFGASVLRSPAMPVLLELGFTGLPVWPFGKAFAFAFASAASFRAAFEGTESRVVRQSTLRKWQVFLHHVARGLTGQRIMTMQEDQVTSADLLRKVGLDHIEVYVGVGQLRYLGHLPRLPDERVETQMLYTWLTPEHKETARKMLTTRQQLWSGLRELMLANDVDDWHQRWFSIAQQEGGSTWNSMINQWAMAAKQKATLDRAFKLTGGLQVPQIVKLHMATCKAVGGQACPTGAEGACCEGSHFLDWASYGSTSAYKKRYPVRQMSLTGVACSGNPRAEELRVKGQSGALPGQAAKKPFQRAGATSLDRVLCAVNIVFVLFSDQLQQGMEKQSLLWDQSKPELGAGGSGSPQEAFKTLEAMDVDVDLNVAAGGCTGTAVATTPGYPRLCGVRYYDEAGDLSAYNNLLTRMFCKGKGSAGTAGVKRQSESPGQGGSVLTRVKGWQAGQEDRVGVTCFDIVRAYTRVCRTALWELLTRMGVPDEFLAVLRALHDHTRFMVFVHNGYSEAVIGDTEYADDTALIGYGHWAPPGAGDPGEFGGLLADDSAAAAAAMEDMFPECQVKAELYELVLHDLVS